jgi:hypothetical protein
MIMAGAASKKPFSEVRMSCFAATLLFLTIFVQPSQAVESTLTVPVAKSTGGRDSEVTEITRVDFIKTERLRSTNLSVLGLRLGENVPLARAAIEEEGLSWAALAPDRAEVRDGLGKALLVISIQDESLTEIAIHDGLAAQIPGRSRSLFDKRILDKDSPLRLELLGREDRRSVFNNPVLQTVEYLYEKEGLRIGGFSIPGSRSTAPTWGVNVTLRSPAKSR